MNIFREIRRRVARWWYGRNRCRYCGEREDPAWLNIAAGLCMGCEIHREYTARAARQAWIDDTTPRTPEPLPMTKSFSVLAAVAVALCGCIDRSNPRPGTVYCPSAPPLVVDSAVLHFTDRDALQVHTASTHAAFPLRFSPACSFRWGTP